MGLARKEQTHGARNEAGGLAVHRQRRGRADQDTRTALGWSQREVAIRMRPFGFDWNQTNVSKIEAGTRGVRVNEAAAFASVFDVPLGELLDVAGPGPQAAAGETERAIRERIAAEILGRYPAGAGPDEDLPGPDAAVEGGADG